MMIQVSLAIQDLAMAFPNPKTNRTEIVTGRTEERSGGRIECSGSDDAMERPIDGVFRRPIIVTDRTRQSQSRVDTGGTLILDGVVFKWRFKIPKGHIVNRAGGALLEHSYDSRLRHWFLGFVLRLRFRAGERSETFKTRTARLSNFESKIYSKSVMKFRLQKCLMCLRI